MKVIFLLLVCGLAFVSAAPPKTPVSLPLQKDKLMALAAEKGNCLDCLIDINSAWFTCQDQGPFPVVLECIAEFLDAIGECKECVCQLWGVLCDDSQ